jgi:hypothetical protein
MASNYQYCTITVVPRRSVEDFLIYVLGRLVPFTTSRPTTLTCRMLSSIPMSANITEAIIEAIQKRVRANIKMQPAAFYENPPHPASPKAGPAPSL